MPKNEGSKKRTFSEREYEGKKPPIVDGGGVK